MAKPAESLISLRVLAWSVMLILTQLILFVSIHNAKKSATVKLQCDIIFKENKFVMRLIKFIFVFFVLCQWKRSRKEIKSKN